MTDPNMSAAQVAGAEAAPIERPSPDAAIDALFSQHFADTTLANNTPLWNAAMALKADLKKLVATFAAPKV